MALAALMYMGTASQKQEKEHAFTISKLAKGTQMEFDRAQAGNYDLLVIDLDYS